MTDACGRKAAAGDGAQSEMRQITARKRVLCLLPVVGRRIEAQLPLPSDSLTGYCRAMVSAIGMSREGAINVKIGLLRFFSRFNRITKGMHRIRLYVVVLRSSPDRIASL